MAPARRHAFLILTLAASLASSAVRADEGPAPDASSVAAKPAATSNPFGALDLSIAPQEGRSSDDGNSPSPPPVAAPADAPAPALATPQAAVPQPSEVAQQPAPPSEEAGKLKARAQTAMDNGDIAAARSLLVAAGRDPEAERLLAEAWDPDVLSRLGVVGIVGDAAKAKAFYDRASADGAAAGQPSR